MEEANPSRNFGTSSTLRVQGGSDPDIRSYLRFTVSGLSGPVRRATLRLYVTNGTTNGPAVYATSGTTTHVSGPLSFSSRQR